MPEAAPRPARLRVIDEGSVGTYRSQALWHGIASAMRAGELPTLSFCRPSQPYVCLGYHGDLADVDQAECRRRGLPVLRRRIGGGPVYIDDGQLFFQITLPAELAPARIDRLYERFLGPAVAAFTALGLDARLNGVNDIAVGKRKISGTGAGRIGDGVTVVGNVIFHFQHERMVEILALPSDQARRCCAALMRRHVSSLVAERLSKPSLDEAKQALVDSYARALGRRPLAAATTDREEREIAAWESRFADPAWLAGPPLPVRPGRRVKISADAWLWFAAEEDLSLEAAFADGRIDSLAVNSSRLNGAGAWMSRKLEGSRADPESVRLCLADFGAAGSRVAALLLPGLAAP